MLDWNTIVPLGQVVVTRGVADNVSVVDVCAAIARHGMCDWGELCDHDLQANDQALLDEGRLLSRYTASNGKPFWIITEADRSMTTVLLAIEY
jgi:hypothetical protein